MNRTHSDTVKNETLDSFRRFRSTSTGHKGRVYNILICFNQCENYVGYNGP
jgi:hypothetical protein